MADGLEGGFGGAGIYYNDPRLLARARLAQMLTQQGTASHQNYTNIAQPIAQAVNGLLGGLSQGSLDAELTQRRQQYQNTVGQASQALMSGDYESAGKALGSNPDTAAQGLGLAGQFGASRLALANALMEKGLQITPQGIAPLPGYAQTQANLEGAKAGATAAAQYPFDVGKALAGQGVTAIPGGGGFQVNPTVVQAAAAKAGAAKAAEQQSAGTSLITLTGPTGESKTLDQNHQQDQIDQLLSSGWRAYNQQSPGENTAIDIDKAARTEALDILPKVARQKQTLQTALTLLNDPSFKSGRYQDLSANARAFLTDFKFTDKNTVNTQQAFESALSRLTFQEAPTLNVKTIRQQMLPLMQQVQGDLGNRPEANKAAVLMGNHMADWDLGRINAVQTAQSPNAAKAENDYIQNNPVATPEFRAAIHTTLNPNQFVTPKFNTPDQFLQYYKEYSPYWNPAQKAEAKSLMQNLIGGQNNTGTTITLGAQ